MPGSQRPRGPPPDPGRVYPETAADLLVLTIAAGDWNLTDMVVAQVNYELELFGSRPGAPAPPVIAGWIKRIRVIDGLMNAGRDGEAAAATAELRRVMTGE